MTTHLDDIAKQVVQLFKPYTRVPTGAKEALKNAKNADEDSLDRTIVEKNEQAFLAFYSAKKKKDATDTFKGQANLRRQFDQLDELIAESPSTKERFAELLHHEIENTGPVMSTHLTTPSPQMVESASDANIITQPTKRPRLQTIGSASNTDTIAERTERSLRTIVSASNADIDVATYAIQQSTPLPSYADQLYVSQHKPGQDAPPRDLYDGAPLKVAEKLFEDDFWDSIQRRPSNDQPGELKADISILFQQDHMRATFGCQIQIGIVKEKVAIYASQLFNATVRENDGVRSLMLKGGARVEPDPSTKLRGCRRDLSDTFKGHLYEGFCLSPIYIREAKEGRKFTDAVSMSISSRTADGATIVVYVSEWSASKIRASFNK